MFPWLDTLQGAAAVEIASRQGVFDGERADVSPLLQVLLQGAGVLDASGDVTADFAAAWAERGADIAAVAGFYRRVGADIATGLQDLLDDLPGFMERSNTFRMFRYDAARGTDADSLAKTAEWVAYLEALARVEAPVLAPLLPFSDGQRVLEVGGNTGVTAAELATRGIDVTVFDLPAVCALGRERRPGVTFHSGDFFETELGAIDGAPFDAVLFKSVLHDWPEDRAVAALERSLSLIREGGTVVICERGAFDAVEAAKGGMAVLANLVFAPFYRDPSWYEDQLVRLGCAVERVSVELDMPFHIVTGHPGG